MSVAENDQDDSRQGLHRPTVDDFVFQGESTPLLLRKRVLAAVVGGFLLVVIAYTIAARMLGISLEINAEPFREWVDDWGIWGPIVYIVVLAVSVLFAPIPNIPIFIAAGLAWGWVIGTVYSMAGLMLGSTMAFWVSRRFGRRFLPRLIGGKAAQRVDDLTLRMGGRLVFWTRMVPVVNFDFLSYLAGLTAIPFRVFFLYTSLGLLTPTIVAVVAGDSLDRDVRVAIAAGGLWVAGILISAFYFWYRRRRWQNAQARERESAAANELP